ncbi:hypothetical protein K1T71_013156 [Dendrolimus kikuchii]|uniref:Uncharacterized protein n=1 Tax=Dendrolimus kikuchii TaxID=765133 RepID=A0ACC1CJJ2_9NEOP|nr:hypothetical protein K1T71_013156 [Dendrolimus kikuchii]
MRGIVRQFLCCILLSTLTFMIAFANAWPSYTITILKGPHSPIGYSITDQDVNLIGSFPLLGSLIGTLFGAFISESLGRKKTEILCGLMYGLSWSLIATAKSVTLLLVARLILGFGGGVHLVTVLVYINEISKPSVCGVMINLLFFIFSLGTLTSYICGWFCSYYAICYGSLSHAIAFVVLMCLLKDSPGYLIGKGREKEALESLKFYRGVSVTTQGVLDELAYIISQREINDAGKPVLEKSPILEEIEKLKLDEKQEKVEESSWKILCTSKASQRALITATIIIILNTLTGMSGIQAYAGQLFMIASPELSPDFCSVVLAVVLTVSGGLSAVVTDMFGRRTLLLFSTITSTLSLILLGLVVNWQWVPRWVVPCMVLLYCAGFQLGACNIPMVQLGESLKPQVKSLGTSINTCCMFASSFISLLIFLPSVEHLGFNKTFFIFAVISAISTIFIYFVMKETKGVKFDAVQEMFEKGYLYRGPIKS